MTITPMLEFYDKVMHISTEAGLTEVETKIKEAVLNRTLTDDRDIMTLNLAIQLRYQHFILADLIEQVSNQKATTIIFGDPESLFGEHYDELLEPELPPMIPDDVEQDQLDSFQDEELDQIRNGNVLPMKGFGKKE